MPNEVSDADVIVVGAGAGGLTTAVARTARRGADQPQARLRHGPAVRPRRRRTIEARKDKRGDRIYLDVMRNAYAQTAVAPYAVRARRGAPVAIPPEWDELGSRGLRADRFTIRDIPKRVAEQGDPWADLTRHARSLTRPMQRLTKLRA